MSNNNKSPTSVECPICGAAIGELCTTRLFHRERRSLAYQNTTHCLNGHRYTSKTLHWRKGRTGKLYRGCRRCDADLARKYRKEKKG